MLPVLLESRSKSFCLCYICHHR